MRATSRRLEDVARGGARSWRTHTTRTCNLHSRPSSIRPYTSTSRTRPKTALFFPGQGVQRVGMIDPWLESFPNTVKPLLEEIDHTLNISPSLTHLISQGTNAELTATQNAQPAIMATSILILRVLEKEFGFDTKNTVDVTLGHSLGEFAALVAAGNLQFASALKMHTSLSAAEPVLWHQSIQYLHQEEKVKRWIGIGPGKVGRNLVGKEVGMKGVDVKGGGVLALTDPKDLDEFLRALEITGNAGEEEGDV
ncbi:FabD/lysophospholipase-like protein [Aureobasidium pullulans]|uniref:[acyl-carrier-protein] S-malonyltransferase n=1 Tax=Aureobasidium pullulans TaxID=5580 RepID=A0A4S9X960_AURPU|nr:FabD/lysophospholipase-like protein [Aureobasidium pullulans]